jgi:hypothetical protein
MLGKNIEILAEDLLGTPSLKGRTSWRWGTLGSFIVNTQGPRRGRWYSFEDGCGGDALDLVKRHHGGDVKAAMRWAREWLGGAP